MITDALLSMLAAIAEALMDTLIGLVPHFEQPAWIDETGTVLGWLFDGLSSMGVWMPVNFLLTAVAVTWGAKAVGLVLHLTRVTASLITGGGGAA